MVIVLCVTPWAAAAEPPASQPPLFAEYAKRVTYFYKSPDPALGPRMLKELLKPENLEHPFFEKNAHVLTIVSVQLAAIATGRPKLVREYEAAFADAPLAGRRVIVRSLMDCGDKDTVPRIDGWLADGRNADLRQELEALKKHLEDPRHKPSWEQPARTPDHLDWLWSTFFITGQYAPVSRILDVFDLPDARENEVLKRVAKWSVGSNLQQHPKLVELVQEHARDRPEGSRKVIDELIKK
jgi:hypothetical protein